MINFLGNISNWFKSWKEKDYIYNNNLWFSFGNVTKLNKIYTSQQDNDLLIDYFNNVAEVSAPVMKYADGAKQVKVKANIPEVQALLDKPNYYQGGDEFQSLMMVHKRLFGESIINSVSTTSLNDLTKKPKELFLLTPQKIGIKTTKKSDFRLNKIVNYVFKHNDNTCATIIPENILHIRESNPNFENEQYLFGESRFAGSVSNIQSIIAGYGAKVNLYDNGPRFFITGKAQGEFGSANESEDIKDVQDRMKKYGWSKEKYNNLITDKALDVTKASMNIRELQLNENNIADFKRICDLQNIDVKVFSENGKYQDKEQALSDFYNNAFRSEVDAMYRDIETFLKKWWPDLQITLDYSEITEIVNANIEENERLFKDVERGLITRNEYNEKTGRETVNNPEFDKLYTYYQGTWTSIELNQLAE